MGQWVFQKENVSIMCLSGGKCKHQKENESTLGTPGGNVSDTRRKICLSGVNVHGVPPSIEYACTICLPSRICVHNVTTRRKKCPLLTLQEEVVFTMCLLGGKCIVCALQEENVSRRYVSAKNVLCPCASKEEKCQQRARQEENVTCSYHEENLSSILLQEWKSIIAFQVETGSTMCLLWRNCFHYMHTKKKLCPLCVCLLEGKCVPSVSTQEENESSVSYQEDKVFVMCLPSRQAEILVCSVYSSHILLCQG